MRLRRLRSLTFAALAKIVAVVAFLLLLSPMADGGVQPSVGLYYTLGSDPQIGSGQAAPLWQLLIRTDSPSIYFKSGAANTAWTRLGVGTSGGGSVTSIDCQTGLLCTPDPIVAGGTIDLNMTTTSCPAGSAEITTAANGTSTCGVFVNAVGTGLQLTGSSASLNITPTTCAAGSAKVATASDGTATCAAFLTSGISGTTNTVAKFASSTTLGNSSVTDDGTTWAINTDKVSVIEASGNTTIAGTLDTPSALFTASGGLTSTAATTTIGNRVNTVQSDDSADTTDFPLASNATTLYWGDGVVTNASFSGIAGATQGREFSAYLGTTGARSLVFLNNQGTTTANRTNSVGATSNVIQVFNGLTNASAGTIFIYNSTRSRWMEVARSGPRFDYPFNNQQAYLQKGAGRWMDNSVTQTLSTCGTSPTITNGSAHFTVTTGTGATACTISFGTAITNPSTCSVTSQSGVQPAYSYTNPSIVLGAGTTASTKYDVNCILH